MIRISKYILLAIVLVLHGTFAQYNQVVIDPPLSFQPGLQDSLRRQSNFYDLAGNISALFEDESVFSLQAGGNFNHVAGQFRSSFEPEQKNNQRYYIQLVKPLTENDIFKGNFGYQRLVDDGLLWIHQTRQLETNTFLLADSSRGKFILNGLFWKAEWAHQLPHNWSTGLGFYYNVDQRLKQNFPKPENIHRDIHGQLGLQKSWRTRKLGLTIHYFDEQEKVEINRYNLDQDLTPVLYKFRWSDLPVIILGKSSEERIINYRGFSARFQISQNLGSTLRILADAGYGNSSGSVVDGGSQPQDQGDFTRADFSGQVMIHWEKSASATVQLQYRGHYRRYQADPPEFELTGVKHPAIRQQMVLRWKRKFSTANILFCDIGYEYYQDEYQDLMTVNSYLYRYHSPDFKLGYRRRISPRWDFLIWSGIRKYYYDRRNRTDNRYSDFFEVLFVQPYRFLTEKSLETGTGLKLIYHYGPVFDAELLANYGLLIPTDNFKENIRRENLLLNFSIKFFIL